MSLFSSKPKSYEVQGKQLLCLVCSHDEFHKREAQLNTAMSTFFKLDWTDPSALCFVCDRCGHIHWFLRK